MSAPISDTTGLHFQLGARRDRSMLNLNFHYNYDVMLFTGHGKTGVEKKDPNGGGPVRASQSAFLGPQIWDKTLSLDLMGDFKDFELEYMDLDEFFNVSQKSGAAYENLL